MWIFAVGIVLHITLVNAILYQNYGVLPTATPLPISVWDSVNSPVLTAYDNTLVTSNDISKLSGYGTDYYHPQVLQTTYGTVKSPSDVIDDSLYGYYHNGRILKQYFVAEENIDDVNALNSFLSRFMPFVPNNFNVPASKLPNLGFPTASTTPTALPTNPPYSINNLYALPRISAVPVQLGSGSLGYVRLPNGAVYLGSGSLGYTNDQQKAEQLQEVRNRQSPQASPLTFGETPR